jgi:hypothetical protein
MNCPYGILIINICLLELSENCHELLEIFLSEKITAKSRAESREK